jgi:prenyltransferase beta subunit
MHFFAQLSNLLIIYLLFLLLGWLDCCRQVGGYQGRTNKDPDSCYSFWVGATLHFVGAFVTTDIPSTQRFLLGECQQSKKYRGGFSKLPDSYPDLMHTFYSLCWLTMSGEHSDALKTLDPALGICSEKANNVYHRNKRSCSDTGTKKTDV